MSGWLSAALGLLAAILSTHAGVTVTENVSPGATSWPGSPILSTLTNPASQATVGESFNGGTSGNTNISQTFTINTTNYTLQTIDLYVASGTGTGSGTNLTLNLFDLGGQTAPNPSPYTSSVIGVNLLGSGAGLPITYFSQANAILELDFTGADQVVLQAGHMYAFELRGAVSTQPMFWYRSTSDTYAGGAAYRNQAWINGTSGRDFALAVYATSTSQTGTNATAISTVDWNDVHQRIDGFGASSAWKGNWTTAQADMFFSTNTGAGLSLLRSRIAPDGTSVETNIMQMAQARGARVWSATWSPPAAFKGANVLGMVSVNGGTYLGGAATNQAYANQLAGYVANMTHNYGVNIYAISVQNEPDTNTTNYESCVWSAQQFHDFVPYLSAALAASNASSTRIMLPESIHWQSNTNLYTTAMNDPNVASLVSIIANHNYDGSDFDHGATSVPAPLPSYGKATWETEVSTGASFDGSITDGLYWAGRIHQFMTVAQANAWHYWWLIDENDDNEGLTDQSGNPAKRMYVLGQFSRFVRPSFYRIGATNTGSSQVSAYKDSASPAFAFVAINSASTTVTQVFNLTNFTAAGSVTPWITSSNLSLASQSSVALTNASFAFALPAASVVTFVGQADLAPTNISLSNASIPENQPAGTTIGALSTTGPYAGNSFAYTLVGGAGSTDNGSFTISGTNLLSAASFNYEAQNTFSIRVRSTDPSGLYVEKIFTITVTDVNEPPSLAPMPNLSVGAGVTLTITNVATDPDVPPQTLTFSLLSGPVGSTLNPTNGVLSWRPLVSQAGTTNIITVVVADNGTPSLSATNSYTITVNLLNPAALNSIAVADDQISIVANGPVGPDYTLLSSTNLLDWQPLLTTNPAAMPFSLTDTNLGDAARFYRLQLGP
jgi:glucuronoarabinoxylan endo-1,4-beta-xylanase